MVDIFDEIMINYFGVQTKQPPKEIGHITIWSIITTRLLSFRIKFYHNL